MTESPLRSLVLSRRPAANSTTRSSSARPTTRARRESPRTSLTVTTSPVTSGARDKTTLIDSLRTTSCPGWSSPTRFGATLTRILRPPEWTSAVASSLRVTTVP